MKSADVGPSIPPHYPPGVREGSQPTPQAARSAAIATGHKLHLAPAETPPAASPETAEVDRSRASATPACREYLEAIGALRDDLRRVTTRALELHRGARASIGGVR